MLVLAGVGPMGTGMEETYQLTSALKFIPWGKNVPIITDARFSGVSTGACIGHVGPEALAGGPIGKLRDGDIIEIEIDRVSLSGSVDLVGTAAGEIRADEAQALLDAREPHPGLQPHPDLPADTRLWAALQAASGGVWAGSVYDVDKITEVLQAGMEAVSAGQADEARLDSKPSQIRGRGLARQQTRIRQGIVMSIQKNQTNKAAVWDLVAAAKLRHKLDQVPYVCARRCTTT